MAKNPRVMISGKVIKNLLFDWSGVISNDFDLVHEGMMAVFDYYGVPRISKEQLRKEFRLPYAQFYEQRIPQFEFDEARPIYMEAFRHAGKPQIYPGTRPVLQRLKGRGIKMAVLSTHPQFCLDREVDRYGTRHLFVEVTGSIHDKRDVIWQMIDRNGFRTEETAFLGDMMHDIDTAKKVTGLTSIACTWGYQEAELLRTKFPDHEIAAIGKLEGILG